ncbi:MAG: 3-hydroxybutyryl-CoA dehydrogenase [Elusimicrobia bacterium]|nr:3-hydroxybutyryl-CoA dehydrogenase [Elusimicrobiota bacterium]
MFQKVAVIGAGTMGRGIAQVCAQSGFKTALYDNDQNTLGMAKEKIAKDLNQSSLFKRINDEQAKAAWANLTVTTTLEEAAHQSELVIEAILEDLSLKKQLFEKLEKIVSQETLLASNTSSLSIAGIAGGATNPGRILGLHFFNPPPVMKLIEVVRAAKTSRQAFDLAWNFCLKLHKTPVPVKDSPGFIVNRVLRPFYLEALRLLGAGACRMSEIDHACRDIGQAPMGPFSLVDLIGLDVSLAVTISIYEAMGRPERFKPVALQERLVQAGHLGRKTGRGFYLYSGHRPAGENPTALENLPEVKIRLTPQEIWLRLAGAVRQEAELLVQENVADAATIDLAVRLGANFPQGPFEWNVPGMTREKASS